MHAGNTIIEANRAEEVLGNLVDQILEENEAITVSVGQNGNIRITGAIAIVGWANVAVEKAQLLHNVWSKQPQSRDLKYKLPAWKNELTTIKSCVVGVSKILKVTSVKLNALFVEFDLLSTLALLDKNNRDAYKNAQRTLLNQINDLADGEQEYELALKPRIVHREKILNSDIDSMVKLLSKMQLTDAGGSAQEESKSNSGEDTLSLNEVLVAFGVTGQKMQTHPSNLDGCVLQVEQDNELQTNRQYAAAFVKLCLACAVGGNRASTLLNDKYTNMIKAKTCYGGGLVLQSTKFSLMGHSIILHGPNIPEIQALREWVGGKSVWHSQTRQHQTKSQRKFSAQMAHEHPLDLNCTRAIYDNITRTLDKQTLR